ncbi:MAG: c-type cytochrome [Lysobacteraceae bacterium]
MNRWLKWALVALVSTGLLASGVLAAAWVSSDRALRTVWDVPARDLAVAVTPDLAGHGAYLFETRSCAVCHGGRGEGKLYEDVPPIRLFSPNLTPAGQVSRYTDAQLARAIRQGIRHDGTPLVFMPVEDYVDLSDADTAALIAHLRALPPVSPPQDAVRVKPLGRVLYLLGQFPMVPAQHIDHSPRVRTAPPVGPTAEYGAYVARTCVGCHGEGFAGQRVPGTPPHLPAAADLTVMGQWDFADFERAMRQGKRRDGSDLHPLMPWSAYRAMTDEELTALFAYFASLGQTPRG